MDIDKLSADECSVLITKLRARKDVFWKQEIKDELKRRGFIYYDSFEHCHDGGGWNVWAVKKNDGYYKFFHRDLQKTYNRLCVSDHP